MLARLTGRQGLPNRVKQSQINAQIVTNRFQMLRAVKSRFSIASKMRKPAKPKIGIIYSSEESSWQSCVSISANLQAAYLALEADFQLVWIPMSPTKSRNDLRYGNGYTVEQAQLILGSRLNKICFIDHHVEVLPLILALRSVHRQKAAALDYYLHVYGDFTYFSEEWQRIGQEISGFKVALICASQRQAALVKFFERRKIASNTSVCPFPVDTNFFAFSASARKKARAHLKLENEHLVFYSGRLSLQKGVVPMIEAFSLVAAENPSSVLAIAGPCDDIGCPVTGINLPSGYFFHRLEEVLSGLPVSIRNRIRLLGNRSRDELRGLYSAADSFVSLSLYHDEDFGMSPAEALASGLPCLLSDWGGYASFGVAGASVRYVPVGVESRGLVLDNERARTLLSETMNEKVSNADRLAAGKAFAETFSIASVVNVLRDTLSESPRPFLGFDWQLGAPRSVKNLKQGMYESIYRNYVSEPRTRVQHHNDAASVSVSFGAKV